LEKIYEWKVELIKRDTLYEELRKTYFEIIDEYAKKDLIGKYRVQNPVFEDIKNRYASPFCSDRERTAHEKKYPKHWKIFRLQGELASKWHFHFNFDFSKREISIVPYTNDEIIWIGSAPFDGDYNSAKASKDYPAIRWTPYPNPLGKEPIVADINEFVTPGYKATNHKWLPLLIDISRHNNKKDNNLLNSIWKIIEERLEEKPKPRMGREPSDEYPELAFLYSLSERIFKNYLEWYDIHIQERLSFKLIARYDQVKKTNPQGAHEQLEKFKAKKVVWGKPIRGEDKIEKGIKLIYSAIHRAAYSRKAIASNEPIIEQYNCSTHGVSCPISCKNYKEWLGKFNRLYRA